jgi:hypothetical protein
LAETFAVGMAADIVAADDPMIVAETFMLIILRNLIPS